VRAAGSGSIGAIVEVLGLEVMGACSEDGIGSLEEEVLHLDVAVKGGMS
jgi:hypothetical protein